MTVREIPMPVEAVARHVDAGGWTIDLRHRMSFAGCHVPDSVNVELAPDLGRRVAALLPQDATLVLIPPFREEPAVREAATRLRRAGLDRILGYLKGGMDAWREAGRAATSLAMLRARDAAPLLRGERGTGPLVIDVREPAECDAGRVPGALPVPLSDLRSRMPEIPPERELVVVAAAGGRASTAASLLAREGRRAEFVGVGDAADLIVPERALAAGI